MTIRSDPEGNEIRALLDQIDVSGKLILEIGCGDGRLTRRYAEHAAHVTAIDPFHDAIERARAKQSGASLDRVEFRHIAFEEYASVSEQDQFDIAILSWSL